MDFLCSDLIKTDQVPWLKGNMNKQVLFLSQKMEVVCTNAGPLRSNCFSFLAASWLSTWWVRYIGGIHTSTTPLPDSTLNFDDGTIANLPRTKAFKKDGRKPTAIFASSSVLV